MESIDTFALTNQTAQISLQNYSKMEDVTEHVEIKEKETDKKTEATEMAAVN